MLVAVSNRNTMTTLQLTHYCQGPLKTESWKPGALLFDGCCLPPRGRLWNYKPHNAYQEPFICPHPFINLYGHLRQGCTWHHPPKADLAIPNKITRAPPFYPAIPWIGTHAEDTPPTTQKHHCTIICHFKVLETT